MASKPFWRRPVHPFRDADVGEHEPALRFFGFFNCRFERNLWQVLLEGLKLDRGKDMSKARNVLLV